MPKACRLSLQTSLLCVWGLSRDSCGERKTPHFQRSKRLDPGLRSGVLPPAPQIGHVWNVLDQGRGVTGGRTWSWCVSTSLFLLLLHSFCQAAKSYLSPFVSLRFWKLPALKSGFVLCSSAFRNTVHKFRQLTQDGNWKPTYCHGDLGLL